MYSRLWVQLILINFQFPYHLFTPLYVLGMKAAISDLDKVITAYRAHGWTYLMGVPAAGVLAELAGRVTGCSRGKGGSMHTYGMPNFFGGNGIVGTPVC